MSEMKQKKIKYINEITYQILVLIFLNDLIAAKWEEYELDPDEQVSPDTIYTRVKRGNLAFKHRGVTPILPRELEKGIAATLLVMQKMRQPYLVSESIAFANSLIEGSEYK
jgi:hypothetical protein